MNQKIEVSGQNSAVETQPPPRDAEERSVEACPEHLVELPGGSWGLWRWVGLRGAGFPASEVLKVSVPACGAVADNLLRLENEAEPLRREALGLLIGEAKAETDKKRRSLLRKAEQRLRQNRVPETVETESLWYAAAERFGLAYARVREADAAFQEAFAQAERENLGALAEFASDERFREAVVWQNRRAIHTGVDSLLRKKDEPSSSKLRQYEELIASYVQRYYTKNDTIGFFGPVGWARLIDHGPAMRALPGAGLVASRSVYFEGWCIDTLAEKLSTDPALKPWLAPRTLPYIYLQGTTVHLATARPLKVSEQEALLLQVCDGERAAKELAGELLAKDPTGFRSEAHVYSLLEGLGRKGLLMWTLEVPIELHPEISLRSLLERIGDEPVRTRSLKALDELVNARDMVAQAAGDSAKLDQAMGHLEETFTRLTGIAPTKSAGQTYAARTLIYEDCRRDIEVEIGPEFLESLGPPLSLLLASARWLTYQLSEVYRVRFRELYDELAGEKGSSELNLVKFFMRTQATLFGSNQGPPEPLLADFQQRWAGILDIPADRRQVNYTSDELLPRVRAAFAAPQSRWRYTRLHCPDVMVAASGVDAICRGDYQLVLGEMHLALNTLTSSIFVSQHPAPEELLQAVETDFPEPRLVPTAPRHWLNQASRTQTAVVSSKDPRLVFGHDTVGIPKSLMIPISTLLVDELDGELVVRSRDGRHCYDIMEVLGDMVTMLAVNYFKIFPKGVHRPRVSIDRLVISRESWSFPASELDFAYETDAADRFLAIRSWAAEHGIPRFFYFKVPVERKPCYMDLDSPIFIRLFAKLIRNTVESDSEDEMVSMSEMLPGIEETWLPGNGGELYTSELRLVAVDRTPVDEKSRPQDA